MTAAEEGCGDGSAAVVVVGVNIDKRSRELLTWALVKVAKTGDRVIALHVVDPNADKSSLISLVKTFDSVLNAYEGFCNLKQVDLKLKVCRGSPVHKILPKEAKSCGATCLILGSAEIHHKLRSRISVAKYCAKNLQKNVSVLCVDNGKILYQRESNDNNVSDSSCTVDLGSRFIRKKTLVKSPLSLPPQRDLLPSSSSVSNNVSMALVPVKPHDMAKHGRWAMLRKVFLHKQKESETSTTKKPSLKQRILRRPTRQSVAAIYPDQKQITPSDKDEYHLDSNHCNGAVVLYPGGTHSIVYSKIAKQKLEGLANKFSMTCKLFDYQELLLATNSFAPENLIGKGGSSWVCRGSLSCGKEVAVKVLKTSEDIVEEYISEIEIITSLHHQNIISLVGFCIDEDILLLVYNLLSRGSLEENLHGSEKSGNILSWEERYKIALGVAEALDHLHSRTEAIIHRDVKSSNILLSDSFEPQLSDFGLATWASSCIHHLDSPDLAGTFGYLAPEYFMDGKLDGKIDIYAFGVVLLELLTGRRPIDNERPKGQESLVMWVKQILRECRVSGLQDPNLNAYDQNQYESMVLAATLCINEEPQLRPEARVILKLLKSDPEVIEWAKQETNICEDSNFISGEHPVSNIQSFINLALQNLEDDSASVSSTENFISVEDYLGGRYSRSSSFD